MELHHIEPWAKVKTHEFVNLVALCPTDHARAEKGEIDRKSLRIYKSNLAILNSRYGELERRFLDMFAQEPENHVLRVPRNMDFELMYLMRDGLVARVEQEGGVFIGEVRQGPEVYVLTAEGIDFVARWREGRSVED